MVVRRGGRGMVGNGLCCLLAGLADAGGYPTVGDLLRRFGSEVEEFTRRDAERVLTAIYLRPRVPPYDGGARGG